jgi:small GTP-binding protein
MNDFEIADLRKAMSQIKFISDLSNDVSKKYLPKADYLSYLGRVTSLLKSKKKDFLYLDNFRRYVAYLPVIKNNFTVCVVGFPNTGKSSFLNSFTSSKSDVKNYEFTTKSIKIGYYRKNTAKIQVIDCPGTLLRDMDKMNAIEKQSYLAQKYLSDIIFFMFDSTREIDEQLKLLANSVKFMEIEIASYNESLKSRSDEYIDTTPKKMPLFFILLNKIDLVKEKTKTSILTQINEFILAKKSFSDVIGNKDAIIETSMLNKLNFDLIEQILLDNYDIYRKEFIKVEKEKRKKKQPPVFRRKKKEEFEK